MAHPPVKLVRISKHHQPQHLPEAVKNFVYTAHWLHSFGHMKSY